MRMKLLGLLVATAGLSGCVAYPYGAPGPYYGAPGPYYDSGGYYNGGYYSPGVPYVVHPPSSVFIYGNSRFHARPRHDHGRPGHQGRRDRDRDGIPNRFDRDRDGDGVPNRLDRRPSNPRRN